jgi:hypothetical protein
MKVVRLAEYRRQRRPPVKELTWVAFMIVVIWVLLRYIAGDF